MPGGEGPDADLDSADRFGGHGSALAQAYNHPILPLSTRRDNPLVDRLVDLLDFFPRGQDVEFAVQLGALDDAPAEVV